MADRGATASMTWKIGIGISLLHYKDGTWEWQINIPERHQRPEWVTLGKASSRDEAFRLANEAIDRLPDQISN